MKVVLNRAVAASFCLSHKALNRLFELKPEMILAGKLQGDFDMMSENAAPGWSRRLARDDPDLIRVVEELGKEAAGGDSELVVLELPGGKSWRISEIAGYEYVVVETDDQDTSKIR